MVYLHGFNLRIEILIVDRVINQVASPQDELVSISELRFLSLIAPTVSDLCW